MRHFDEVKFIAAMKQAFKEQGFDLAKIELNDEYGCATCTFVAHNCTSVKDED